MDSLRNGLKSTVKKTKNDYSLEKLSDNIDAALMLFDKNDDDEDDDNGDLDCSDAVSLCLDDDKDGQTIAALRRELRIYGAIVEELAQKFISKLEIEQKRSSLASAGDYVGSVLDARSSDESMIRSAVEIKKTADKSTSTSPDLRMSLSTCSSCGRRLTSTTPTEARKRSLSEQSVARSTKTTTGVQRPPFLPPTGYKSYSLHAAKQNLLAAIKQSVPGFQNHASAILRQGTGDMIACFASALTKFYDEITSQITEARSKLNRTANEIDRIDIACDIEHFSKMQHTVAEKLSNLGKIRYSSYFLQTQNSMLMQLNVIRNVFA